MLMFQVQKNIWKSQASNDYYSRLNHVAGNDTTPNTASQWRQLNMEELITNDFLHPK